MTFINKISLNILKLLQFSTVLLQVPSSHVFLYNLIQMYDNFGKDLVPKFLMHCISFLIYGYLFNREVVIYSRKV